MKKKIKARYIIIAVCAVLVIAYAVVGVAVVIPIFHSNFTRVDGPDAGFSLYTDYREYEDTLPREEVSFMSGDNRLTGWIYNKESSKGVIIIVHGFGSYADKFLPETQYFVNDGFAVFTYDGTGVAASEGESRVGLYQAVPDLRSALTFLKTYDGINTLPVSIFGHSQGGFASCTVLNYDEAKDVAAVVSIAGPNEASDIVDAAGVDTIGFAYHIFKPFLLLVDKGNYGKNAPYTAVEGINNSAAKVLLVQGLQDETVPHVRYAITDHIGEITNRNVEVKTYNDDWNSSHNFILNSEDSFRYRTELTASYNEYVNDGEFTDADMYDWAEEVGLDRNRLQAVNPELFRSICDFLD
ncbi:hypothetical protein FACS189499_10110 [Clostridia bacterium]|nr:hypothetical protein FACS189499_10110 [Clostridia bacterium]